jgi:hypothetical protein
VELIVGLTFLAFAAAQGGAVFATAWWGLRRLGTDHWLAKAAAMAVSYAAWIAFTLLLYTLMGGQGGYMDGFALLLSLCWTALVSSGLYLAAWLLAGLLKS